MWKPGLLLGAWVSQMGRMEVGGRERPKLWPNWGASQAFGRLQFEEKVGQMEGVDSSAGEREGDSQDPLHGSDWPFRTLFLP